MARYFLYIAAVFLLSLSIVGCEHKKSYTISTCAYCGAVLHVEGGKSTYIPSRFPSENPPEHMHLYFPSAGYSSINNLFWDGASEACNVLRQLIDLQKEGRLSEDVIKEWFSINIGNPEVLTAFAEKHNLKMKNTP